MRISARTFMKSTHAHEASNSHKHIVVFCCLELFTSIVSVRTFFLPVLGIIGHVLRVFWEWWRWWGRAPPMLRATSVRTSPHTGSLEPSVFLTANSFFVMKALKVVSRIAKRVINFSDSRAQGFFESLMVTQVRLSPCA
jgi:hypothetical protein